MKIVWNVLNSGLGDNGGSRTVILSALAMKKLGHEVFIAGHSKFTWFKFDIPIVKKISDCDLVIATSCNTVKTTLLAPAKTKAYYIRAYEVWAQSKHELLRGYNSGLVPIVNSSWLQKVVPNSIVVYQGIDLDVYKNLNNRRVSPPYYIGCLYNIRHKTKRWDEFVRLRSLLGKNYKFVSFGTEPKPKFVDIYLRNPSTTELVSLYNLCHFWFSPSELEGLHNVPMEAGLCGCNVIGVDHVSAGTQDYILHRHSGYLYKDLRYASKFFNLYDEKLSNNMVKVIHEKIGSREAAMQKFLEVCEYV